MILLTWEGKAWCYISFEFLAASLKRDTSFPALDFACVPLYTRILSSEYLFIIQENKSLNTIQIWVF